MAPPVMNCAVNLTPDDFVGLLVREHKWLELLLAAMRSRVVLRTATARELADEAGSVLFALRATQLRN